MSNPLPKLTISDLTREAKQFAERLSDAWSAELFGVSDGKALGTFCEHAFKARLKQSYEFEQGSSARGIDFPGLNVDMKITSIEQPQSSCPFRSPRQKIYGLGYGLLVFAYEKHDDVQRKVGRLEIMSAAFVDSARTGDYELTKEVREIVARDGTAHEVMQAFARRKLPLDEPQASLLAAEVFHNTPKQGYLTISNALQWRLQYHRVVDDDNDPSNDAFDPSAIDGLDRIK